MASLVDKPIKFETSRAARHVLPTSTSPSAPNTPALRDVRRAEKIFSYTVHGAFFFIFEKEWGVQSLRRCCAIPGKEASPLTDPNNTKRKVLRMRGLRQRWLWHSSLIVCARGVLCVLLVTAGFSAHLYNAEEKKILSSAEAATAYFNDRVNKNEAEYYDACVIYTQTCNPGDWLEVQFVDTSGAVISSSDRDSDLPVPGTPEIQKAVKSRGSSA